MSRFFNASVAILLGLGVTSCGKDEATGPDPAGAIRVLFLGNSLTYENDLPGMVEAVAAAAGESIVTESIALPNYALIDHWNDGVAQETIRTGHFDYVVLQQGPSSLQLSRDTLRLATTLFAPVIRNAGGVPALFAVWPELDRFSVFPIVAESYRLAAEDVDGVYLPVGNTWLGTWDDIPDAPLYGPDGYHPGIAGTYAAAVVMVSKLTNRDPTTLPLNVPGVSLSQTLMTSIHAAARAAIAANSPQRLEAASNHR